MTRKRFYKTAAATKLADGGYGVALDGRILRSPGGMRLAVPSLGLADSIAAEWQAQDADIRPLTMPMTRLAATALDRVGRERTAIVEQIAAYGGTDMLCYRAESPEELVERQAAVWQPLLDWVEERYGARLTVTAGIMHIAQDKAALESLRAAVDAHDNFRLAALSQLTAACGSLVVALAVVEDRIAADGATEASQLDEDWQTERWGQDHEAAQRRCNLVREIVDAGRFLDLLDEASEGTGRS